MKYKVILADDEEQILESIRKSIDWEAFGMEVVETFLNGRDVMEFLETQEADILLTDIRMPFMDGLELAKNVREQYPQMKVIIISGYGDFNYAKEAMSYQVADYILKPVNAKEMGGVLEKVREGLEREMMEKQNFQRLEKQYRENLPFIRENLLNRMTMGDVNRETLNRELENCEISIRNASCWTVVLLQVDRIEGQHFEESKMDETYASVYLCNLVRESCRNLYSYEFFYSRLGQCIIFGMKAPEQIGRILMRLSGVARESRRVMGVCPAIGVGKIKTDLMEAKESFEEAREALLYRRVWGDGAVMYMEDVEISGNSIVLFEEESREALFSACKFGTKEEICQALKRLRSSLERQDMSHAAYQTWFISVLNALLLFCRQYTGVMEEIFGGNPDCMSILNRYGDIHSGFMWLEEKCLSLGVYFTKEREKKASSIIEIAQKYIQQEFGNPEISLEKVAMEIGLTPSYFSSVFKKETGEAFVEYLTRLRLEEAMRMLKKTDEKIHVISEKTGYSDAGYFSYVFKKKYGVSPLQYRRQRKQESC